MAHDLIQFFCPFCGIKLTVPGSKAGVSGPCPACGNTIQAPVPPPPRPEPRPPSPPAEPGTPLKPEPRELPARAPMEIDARPIPAPPAEESAPAQPAYSPVRAHREKWLWIRRGATMALFLATSVALVFGLLKLLNRESPAKAPISDLGLNADATTAADADPDDMDADLPDPLENLEPVSPWGEAEKVLEEFLSAKTLAERMPLMETRLTDEELAATCLASPLPKFLKLVPEYRETDKIENLVDCYYTAELEHDDPATRVLTVLVRARGDQRPRVVAEPFLDSFGGRLAAYAAGPTEKAGTFQVVVYAVASCTNPEVPNHGKKLTLKLLASDTNREIARAYFGRQSKINEILENSAYELKYGVAKACTVLLRWNTEEDPEKPFLEALAIKDFGWNP
jgi:hypothetical protein